MSQSQMRISSPVKRDLIIYILRKSKDWMSAEIVAKKTGIELLYVRYQLSTLTKTGELKVKVCKCCQVGRTYRWTK